MIPDISRVWGIDISHWNQLTDLQTAKNHGCRFVIIKGNDGSVNTRWFTENRDRAKAAGLPWGMYVWLYPDRYVSIIAQVTAWWARVRDDYPPLGVWIDTEWTSYAGVPANPGTIDLNTALSRWRTVTNKPAGVYTARGYSDTYLKGFNFQSVDLWVANYGVTTPALPVGANTWKFWQFTNKLDGSIAPSANLSLDGNYYNGTLSQFENEFNLGGTPPTGGNMANEYYTLYDVQKVYNARGAESGNIPVANTRLTVTAANVVIENRGECFAISSPLVGYIPEARVRVVVVSVPPPPPTPPPVPVPASADLILKSGSTVKVYDTSGKLVFAYLVP